MFIALRSALLLAAIMCAHPAIAAVEFVFTFSDGSGTPGSGGFFDPLTGPGAERLGALEEVAGAMGSMLDHSALVRIDVTTFDDPGSGTLATAGGFFYLDPATADGIVENAVQTEILGGFGPPPPDPHGFIMVNTAKPFYTGADPGAIGGGEKDWRSVVWHEMTHALGWTSALSETSESALSDALGATHSLYTVYDTKLIDGAVPPEPIIDPGTMNLNTSVTPGTGIFFAGPATTALLGDAATTFVVPSLFFNPTHFDPSLPTIMGPSLADGAIMRGWTELDKAVLMDLGYAFVVPEPTVVALVAVGSVLLAARRGARV